ncbi:hypothetical protein EGT74_22415 [Chitinophaga lutea]|uniref:VWA domain-containing protein n=1 Tax=Chitinophaga lutea TaxID=2488634 RepID=A0A3N4PSI1_9BACT|nr:hypothetical protein [Chitinophaga lutea]RPE09729.1 hypothetical protein EGT74_22415 [Chitinophaga lutea]
MKYIVIISIFLLSCGSGNTEPTMEKASGGVIPASNAEKQINLTILLDLSDRIDPVANPDNPEHFERDSALINHFTSYFLEQMRARGTYTAKSKMRLIFHPSPPDPDINQAAKKLDVDLSKMDTKGKKLIYETFQQTVSENISNIYRTTIKQAVWPGSDIWRFFKNDVREVAIDNDSAYRNVLVIFTDGYIYHNDSKDRYNNRYAYLLPELFAKLKLRNNSDWAEEIDRQDFGLISKRADLEHLEILLLEINPSAKFKNDEDIIRKVIDKWFAEMKVKRWKIINTDLPQFTIQKVDNFLQE